MVTRYVSNQLARLFGSNNWQEPRQPSTEDDEDANLPVLQQPEPQTRTRSKAKGKTVKPPSSKSNPGRSRRRPSTPSSPSSSIAEPAIEPSTPTPVRRGGLKGNQKAVAAPSSSRQPVATPSSSQQAIAVPSSSSQLWRQPWSSRPSNNQEPPTPVVVPAPRVIRTTYRPKPVDDKVRRFPNDERRIWRWNEEGWGNHPDNQALVEGVRGYFQVADFPKGVSTDYLGGTRPTNYKAQYGSDGLRFEHIDKALMLDKCPLSAGMLKDTCWALLFSTQCWDKFGPPNGSKAEKEQGFRDWQEKIIKPLTESTFLPPAVRDVLMNRPVCPYTGERLWCQASRCYYYMLDNLALKLAKRLRYDFECAKKEYVVASMRRLDWQP